MDNLKQHQHVVQNAVKKKFKGNKELKSRVTPKYPQSSEREFQRITNGYMKLLNAILKEHLPKIVVNYKSGLNKDSRFDDGDFNNSLSVEFQKIREELAEKISAYGLEDFIKKIGTMTQSRSIREWKRVVRETLGIDIFDDYYKGDLYAKMLQDWAEENVSQIKSIPNDSLDEMQDIILEGYKNGKPIREIQKEIQSTYNTTRHHAAMIARDQIATLNSKLTQQQHRSAGVKKYRWSTSHDSRVRDCHDSFDKQIFDWDKPPEIWYETKSRGRVYTGRRCHPGEDFACRCIAIPVFDIDDLDIPMKDTTQ